MKHLVEPIRDKKKIRAVEDYLAKRSKRNRLLFVLGCNSGLRVSDILALNVKDVRDKTHIELNEKKTGKCKRFPINDKLKKLINEFIVDKSDNEPLFLSQKQMRLDRSQVYRMLNNACKAVGIDVNIGTMGMLDTYNNAFNNMDMRMLLPSSVRIAQRQANRYAITDTAGTEYNYNETNSGGTWVRPFAAYDSVGLKNGPKVDSFSYGTFIGGDSGIHQFKNSGEGVLTAHVSYLGSHQNFAGNSIYQNGGNLGVTGTFYKGNFFSGFTVNAGASVADASTRYSSEDFPMFMAGVANKTGYNFEFKDGRFIIQPNLMLSYTFVNAFDYTNGAGVKINSDPLHALQITPNVKFIMNTKNGWQPYAAFGMHWNIMDETNVTANTAYLPELSVKPYFSYGLGIQRVFGDRFTAYGQIMLRHGGRNGIAANAGLRYIFGHETKLRQPEQTL